MKFNYYIEKRKFEEKWDCFMKQCQDADMSNETIDKMREFDLKEFNSRRRYRTHTQPILSLCLSQNMKDANETDKLSKCSALGTSDTYFELSQPDWVEYVESIPLYKKLKQLSNNQMKILTYSLEGYTHEQIAEIFKVSRQAISKSLTIIKKFLVSF